MTIRQIVGASKSISNASRVLPGGGIAQDNIIFAMILFAFVVWITTKGELGLYLSFFTPGSSQGPPIDTVTASSTTGGAALINGTNAPALAAAAAIGNYVASPLTGAANAANTTATAAGTAAGNAAGTTSIGGALSNLLPSWAKSLLTTNLIPRNW